MIAPEKVSLSDFVSRRLNPTKVALAYLRHEMALHSNASSTTIDKAELASVLATVELFIEDYEKKYGTPADMVAASVHTAINVAANALSKAGTEDTAKIRDAIAATKDFAVATGRISFNEMGEVYKAAQIQIIKGGKFRHYATIDDPKLLAPPTK